MKTGNHAFLLVGGLLVHGRQAPPARRTIRVFRGDACRPDGIAAD